MTALRFALALTALAAAPAAQAQIGQPGPGASAADQHRYQADRNRQEMDRLRAQADQRDTFARQIALDSRLSRLRLEAARQPEPVQPPALRPLRSPEEERVARLSATERRRETTTVVGQIDAWLDRRPE